MTAPAPEELARTVPCKLCKVPVGTACVNSVDGSPRAEPHMSRVTAGQIAAWGGTQ